jgi:hypothetical protein
VRLAHALDASTLLRQGPVGHANASNSKLLAESIAHFRFLAFELTIPVVRNVTDGRTECWEIGPRGSGNSVDTLLRRDASVSSSGEGSPIETQRNVPIKFNRVAI